MGNEPKDDEDRLWEGIFSGMVVLTILLMTVASILWLTGTPFWAW